MGKKRMFERLCVIRDEMEKLKAENDEIRRKLLLTMEVGETIYGDDDMIEKTKKKVVELYPKEKLFEVLGEKKYIELSSIGISSIRGHVSDKKMDKLIKKKTTEVTLTLRRLS
jgi:hypothetical protein